MALRSGHGAGRGTPRIEVLPASELPPALPAGTGRPQRDSSGRFVRGNTVAENKRIRVGTSGGTSSFAVHDDYKPFAAYGNRYAKKRRRELAAAFQGKKVSVGVSAIVDSEAKALAAARYLEARAAATGDPDLFRQSIAAATVARQHALAAWELAAREVTTEGVEPPPVYLQIYGPSEEPGGEDVHLKTIVGRDMRKAKKGKNRT